MIIKPSSVIGKVKSILEDNIHTRDSDTCLVSNVWHLELKRKGFEPKLMTGFGLLDMHCDGKLSNYESIRRARQKLQQEFEHLRGEKYEKRHQNAEKVKQDLKETPEFYKGGTP